MRERIAAAISKALEKSPNSKNLQRQLTLLSRANITTMHSFCLDVIKNYFYTIDLDPSFRIGDETEATLIKNEILEELFEEYYEEEYDSEYYADDEEGAYYEDGNYIDDESEEYETDEYYEAEEYDETDEYYEAEEYDETDEYYETEEYDESDEYYETEEYDEPDEYYEAEEYDEPDEYYETEEYDEFEEEYLYAEYDNEEDFDTGYEGYQSHTFGAGKRDKYRTVTFWGRVVEFLSNFTAFDAIVASTGVVVLVAAIITFTMLSASNKMEEQIQAIAPVGTQLSSVGVVGQSGLLAMADVGIVAQQDTEIEAEEARAAVTKDTEIPANAKLVNSTKTAEQREENVLESMEYRKAFMAYVQNGTEIPAEFRAAAVSTGDTGAAIPVTVMNEVINTIRTYCYGTGDEMKIVPAKDGKTDMAALKEMLTADVASFYVQQPNFFGMIEDAKEIGDLVHEAGAMYVMGCNPIALGVLKTPRECGADVAVLFKVVFLAVIDVFLGRRHIAA